MSYLTRNLGSVIAAALDARMADVHVALPGKIVSYDTANQVADVKPLIKIPVIDLEGNETIEELPVIPEVPVHMPRGGGYFVSFPLVKDDPVLLVFCDYSIDQWQEKGEDVDPGDTTVHGFSGAYAIPGGAAKTQVLSDVSDTHMVLGQDGGKQIWMKGSTIALGAESPGDNLALASLVKNEISALRNTVNTHLQAGGTYMIHTHPSPAGPTGVPINPSTPPAAVGDVKSTIVESE